MKIKVRLFAVARELAGHDHVELELPDGATIGQLRTQLAAEVPQLSPLIRQMMFAIDTQYADDPTVVPPDSDVACIPPVSGG